MSNENRQAMIDATYDRGFEAGRKSALADLAKERERAEKAGEMSVDTLPPLPVWPYTTRRKTYVVVDPKMLERLKLLSSPSPQSKPPYEMPQFISGWPVFLEPALGDERGVIMHADGRVEKFGKWT